MKCTCIYVHFCFFVPSSSFNVIFVFFVGVCVCTTYTSKHRSIWLGIRKALLQRKKQEHFIMQPQNLSVFLRVPRMVARFFLNENLFFGSRDKKGYSVFHRMIVLLNLTKKKKRKKR